MGPEATAVLNHEAAGREASKGYRICTRCVMDTTEPEITFDGNGVCNHCRRYDERAAKELFTGEAARQRLETLVAGMKRNGRGKDYDCLIGVSGGVDSTTVAYHVKQLGLRPLAVHLDNGWDSELAVDNIKRTLDKLGIDLQTHVIDWEEFRDLQLAFLKASVPNSEIPTDHAISALLLKTAAKMRIKHIVTGGNLKTEGIMPISWGYYNQDLKHILAVHRRFGTKKLRTFPQVSLFGYLWIFLVRGIRYIPILNCLDYDKAQAKELIKAELGWRDYGGKHYESIYTRFFQGYILPVKFGFDKRKAHLSTLIASGQITREHALREMSQDAYGNPELLAQDREFVVKKLGLTESEFEAIMKAPAKNHSAYPSHHYIFHEMRALKQWFKRIATDM